MNPNISIACDAVLGAGSENFGTITGNVTFQNGSANSGTVGGNAVFNGNAENKAGATVSGNATFNETSVNAGTVQGNATVDVTASNSGTISGTITAADATFDAWFAVRENSNLPQGHTLVQQYSGPGPKNGKWFHYQTGPLETRADALDIQYNYAVWLNSNTGVNSFTTASGSPVDPEAAHYGQWAFNSTEYGSEAAALAAEESAYQAWLAANTSLAQYSGTGPHNGQWAYGPTGYDSYEFALAAQVIALEAAEAAYQVWLAANTSLAQYSGPGPRNGQWASNSVEYVSQAAGLEALYQIWLSTNIGVSQYLGSGNHYGQWAYNSTEYASQAEAQAAYDAANQ